jgi:radical SAM superfamily enzyme YgiQ (UPF0313 family)
MERCTSGPICLVTPPSGFNSCQRLVPNLGILNVAAALESAGNEIEMVDLSGIRDHAAAFHDYLMSSTSRIFGITATSPQISMVVSIAEAIRSARPGAKIIIGGPHVTLVNSSAKKEQHRGVNGRATKAFAALRAHADVLVSGDGEKAVFEALRDDAPALIDADDLHSPLFVTNADFSTSPFPARHLIDLPGYRSAIDGIPATSIIAQRGCPFACGFCTGRNSPCRRTMRIRPAAVIVNEIESLFETYGYTGFQFQDDVLNVNPHFTELLDRLITLQIRLGKRFTLSGRIKAELFNKYQAKTMRQAGFSWIEAGFESGSLRMLENGNTCAGPEGNARCIETAHRYGIKANALMSIGHPGESTETVAQTRDWLVRNRPDAMEVSIITPIWGSAYFDRAVPLIEKSGTWVYTAPSTGDRLYCSDNGPAGDMPGYAACTATDHLSTAELVALRNGLERDFRGPQPMHPVQPGVSATALKYNHFMRTPEHVSKATRMALVA